MDADVFISLTHFKGHEGAGFGGALKISEWAVVPVPENGNALLRQTGGRPEPVCRLWSLCKNLCP